MIRRWRDSLSLLTVTLPGLALARGEVRAQVVLNEVLANGVRLRFHASQGRTYSLQSRRSMAQASWQTITSFPVARVTGEQELLVPGLTSSSQYSRMLTPGSP